MKRQIKFPAVFRYVENAQEWRLLNAITKSHIQEFKLYECEFMGKIIERLGLKKDKDNLVVIEITRGD